MSIEAGVQKAMSSVINEIDKVQSLQTTPLTKKETIKKNIGKIFSVPVNDILVSENIRSNLNIESNEFLQLVESIKKYGIIQSIVIEFRDKHQDDFELICVAGHRRLEAAKQIGIEKIPCLIQQYNNPSDRTGIALAENLNREGLYSLDIAEGYAELKILGWDEEVIASHFERDIRTIKRYLNISSWPEDVKKIVRENSSKFPNSIIMKKFALKRYGTDDDKEKLRSDILAIALGSKLNAPLNDHPQTEHLKVSKSFSEKFGLKSDLKESGNKGKFTILFSNETEKETLLNLLHELNSKS